MNRAIIDTDIFSELLRARNPNVLRNASSYRQVVHARLTLSVITVMEMVKGLQQAGRPQQIRALLPGLRNEEILPFDQPAAELAGRIWGDLDRTGQTIGIADPMIAAVALRHGLELVTGNIGHYQRVQQLGYPLVLMDWRS